MDKLDQRSVNFQFAKIVSILMVVAGHFGTGIKFFWVPVTVGLFVFAYSSGSFTTAKYQSGFDKQQFWKRKFNRIGVTLLIADCFLLLLFLIQGRPNIWGWETIVSALGLTGLLNWFSIPNDTPFGAGLWFLTLLYIFYVSYPLIKKVAEMKQSLFFATAFSVLMWICNLVKPMGHSLWLTATAFVWGVVIRNNKIESNVLLSFFLTGVSFVIMVVNNFFFSIKIFNFPLILVFSLFVCLLLDKIKIPKLFTDAASFLNGTIFFIYLLHGYLFLSLFQSNVVNTIVSIVFVCAIGKVLELFQKQLVSQVSKVFNKV